ncbi:membrane-associated guanylate kinase, WW and PDZ domain-containing protein 2-like [Platysternon megacephalum]|uniref:Membrane-associated guanylate kinase, WW and PDZ domain-containing protein 2-like n=1 Tax=Platysternon megacephalum TaxID=55544 RepID=A0A4D9E8Y1_9SAUR|nr:membrane-associated guanylate kinase, WW and PDZ domain-containing protein 2-like [Platysternon megacephalum]
MENQSMQKLFECGEVHRVVYLSRQNNWHDFTSITIHYIDFLLLPFVSKHVHFLPHLLILAVLTVIDAIVHKFIHLFNILKRFPCLVQHSDSDIDLVKGLSC